MSFLRVGDYFRKLWIFSLLFGGTSCHSRNQPLSQKGLCFDLCVLALGMGCGARGSRPSTTGAWPVACAEATSWCLLPGELNTCPDLPWHTLSRSRCFRAGGRVAHIMMVSKRSVTRNRRLRGRRRALTLQGPQPSQHPHLLKRRGDSIGMST